MPEPIDIAEGRRLLDAATPGPWELAGDRNQWGEERVIASDGEMAKPLFSSRRAEADLIVWARNNLPALLDENARLRDMLNRANAGEAQALVKCEDMKREVQALRALIQAVRMVLRKWGDAYGWVPKWDLESAIGGDQ
ncbi:hypothetical protein ACYAFX_28735 (plasmid) [Rhodococcus aetherivorans]